MRACIFTGLLGRLLYLEDTLEDLCLEDTLGDLRLDTLGDLRLDTLGDLRLENMLGDLCLDDTLGDLGLQDLVRSGEELGDLWLLRAGDQRIGEYRLGDFPLRMGDKYLGDLRPGLLASKSGDRLVDVRRFGDLRRLRTTEGDMGRFEDLLTGRR